MSHRPTSAAGFTLLEVILALGILAAAFAVIGEVTRLSHHNAERAAMEGEALVIGESIMAQLLAGLVGTTDIGPTEWLVDGEDTATWTYELTFEATELPELLRATVRVEQITADEQKIAIELVRWIVDPNEVEDTSDYDSSTEAGGEA